MALLRCSHIFSNWNAQEKSWSIRSQVVFEDQFFGGPVCKYYRNAHNAQVDISGDSKKSEV